MPAVHGQTPSSDVIRVGLIGAGGRGTSALQQALSVPGSNVKVTAIGDAFSERIDAALKAVEKMEGKVDVPEGRRFTGLDAYKQVLDHCDLVILATPPGFRPYQFDAAIRAGKHVFMEKPVCVDSFGAQLCLAASKMADEKKLKVAVGLQRRYQRSYRETIARIREGMIGPLIGGQVYWNTGAIWYRPRKPEMTETEFQIHNWYHFCWLSGDHICEQHVHQLDVANWFLDASPDTAFGVGGRQVRVPGQPSEIYDHHAVNFSYPRGVRISSHCKQITGGEGRVDEEFQGTIGWVKTRPGFGEIRDYDGTVLWKFEGADPNPYQVEHDELQDAIRNDRPLNNTPSATAASFATVLGRLATYSGKVWKYDDAINLHYRTMPESISFENPAPAQPDKDGNYALPIPSTFKLPDPNPQSA